MSTEIDPHALTLAGVAHRCAQETTLFFRRQLHDPRFCFELFRRAILERNQRACELLFVQYGPLVSGWVQRHPALAASGEEAQYFVNRAFEKLWSAVSPEKFGRFGDLKSLLRYLQMCVHSAILDHVRSLEPIVTGDEAEEESAVERAAAPLDVEATALASASRDDLWRYVNGRLNDEKERLVVYGSFSLALKPGELYARYPGAFTDVKDVYRIKQNVLERLRRDPELAKLAGEYT